MRIMACEAALESAPVGTANQGLLDPLSERELEVLRLFAQGMTNQEIADQLIISLGTVKAHSSNIYRKLDVRNRAEAAVRAGELNLL
jgi:LuxR family maltose regulon positive regulatory protein